VKKPREAVYSEKEAAEIVKLAVELQESHTEHAGDYTPGITLDELKRVAAEVGISENFLEEALKRKGRSPGTSAADPFNGTFERVIDGELRPEDFDLLLDEFKPIPNTPGPSQIGRTLTGKASMGAGQAEVKITARNGRTRIKISYVRSLGCVLLFPAAFLGFMMIIITTKLGVPWLGLILLFALCLGAVKGVRPANHHVDSQAEQLGERLAGKIEAAIEASSNPSLPPIIAEGESQNLQA